MSLKLTAQLMGQRRYVPIWAAQVLGAFNDNLFRFSLVMLATYSGLTVLDLPREQMTPIAATVFTLPIFLFSAVAGQVADRYDRMKIMRVTKLIEIFLMVGAAIGFLLNAPWVLLAVLFLMGVQTAFFIPARTSAMPTVLAPTELVTANALMAGAVNVAILAGAIGGTLLTPQAFGPPVIGATLILVAIIGWLSARQGVPAPASNRDMKISWNIGLETVRLLRFIWGAKDVLRPALGIAWFWMLSAAVITVLPVFARDVLGADANVVAIFQVLFTVGAVTGAMICGILNRGGGALIFTVLGAAGLVVFSTDIALYTANRVPGESLLSASAFLADPANHRILIGLFGAALSGGMFVVPLQAMTQRRADPDRRGRLLAASGILNGAAATLGPFTLFLLARAEAPLQGAFWFVAIGSLIAGLFFTWRMFASDRTVEA
jgi:MFS family permease